MPTPLEEYMSELIQQHKLSESITDTEYESELTQSQAEEEQVKYEIDAQPFNTAARSYNLDPMEWAGKEHEARRQMKAAVSSAFLSSRAQTAANQAQGKREFMQSFMTDLQRLNSVNARGINSIADYAPRDPGLRTQLVIDPDTGNVTQVTKNVPDESFTRTQEISDYLKLPRHVVAKQMAHEQAIENDALWEQHTRMKSLDDDVREEGERERTRQRQDRSDQLAEEAAARARNSEARGARKDVREEDKAAHASVIRRFTEIKTMSEFSPEQVSSIMSREDTPPDMRINAMMADSMRRAKQAAQGETDRQKAIAIRTRAFLHNLDTNEIYQMAITGDDAPRTAQLKEKILNETLKTFDEVGLDTHKYSDIEHREDFGPWLGDSSDAGFSLSDLESAKKKRGIEHMFDDDENMAAERENARLDKEIEAAKRRKAGKLTIAERLRQFTP